MHGVVAGQVCVGFGVAEIVERDDLDLLLAIGLVQRAQDVAADAAVTIDSDFDGHSCSSDKGDSSTCRPRSAGYRFSPSSRSAVCTMFSAVNPKCLNRSFATPDAPKVVMPMTAPRLRRSDAMCQAPPPRSRRALHAARQHLLAIGLLLSYRTRWCTASTLRARGDLVGAGPEPRPPPARLPSQSPSA